ncbi:MAG: hypothetical protein AAF766_04975 [Cyanobacteria bacterium P01_D01_bin.14]
MAKTTACIAAAPSSIAPPCFDAACVWPSANHLTGCLKTCPIL